MDKKVNNSSNDEIDLKGVINYFGLLLNRLEFLRLV